VKLVGFALLSTSLFPFVAWATDANYQNFLLGQRAMGMGGAFVAVADDPSTSWYNPGGLALMKRTSAGASLSLYGIEWRRIDKGLTSPIGTADLRQSSFPILSTTLSVMTKFGSRDAHGTRNAIGISLLLPYSQGLSFRQVIRAGNEAGFYQLSEGDRTLWVGPSFARRFGPDFGIGFSLFYDNRAYSRFAEMASFLGAARPGLPCAGTPTACVLDSAVDAMVGSLFLRLGAIWRVDDHWKLGVAFSTPNIHLHGSADLFNARYANGAGGAVQNVTAVADQRAYNRRPFELRIGSSYASRGSFVLAADLSIHGPSRYQRVDTTEPIADPLFAREARREPVVNLNLGGEVLVRPDLPVRFGLYTNFSSAPEIPDRTSQPYLSRTHMFGGSVSIGYQGDSYGLDFGVSVSFGTGVAQTLDPNEALVLRRTGMSNTLVYFFVSGIGQALAHNVRKLLEQFKEL
jgi:hypothetical protein